MRSDQDTDQERDQDTYHEFDVDDFGEKELQKNNRLMLGLITLFVVAVVVFVLAQNGGAIFQQDETGQAEPVTTASVAPSPSPHGKWHARIETNPLDDSRTVILSVEANRQSSNLEAPIHLLLRCTREKTDVILQWGKRLDEKGALVSTRIGQSPPQTETWNLSTDEKATFFAGDKALFVNGLLDADRFVAQTTPEGNNPMTAIFDISGLDKALEPARKLCGW